jgi:hypothetical protein
MLPRALEDGIQPPVTAQPGKGPFNPLHSPADAGGTELSVPAARDGLDRDAERLTGLGQAFAPVAEIAEGRRRQLAADLGGPRALPVAAEIRLRR